MSLATKTRPPSALHRALALAVFLATACDGDGAAEPRATRPIRIVLLTLDTLRFDALEAEHMPAVSAFAARGLTFRRCYATASTTQPTHATLFTGRQPWEHGVVRNGMVLSADERTLAERLAASGWDNRAVVASFPVHSKFGYAQGFADFRDGFSFERKRQMPETWLGTTTEGEHFSSIASAVTDDALDALDSMQGERQFLWVHYFDAHSPYGDLEERPLTLHAVRTVQGERPEELDDVLVRARALYKGDVARMDAELARLFARLERDEGEYETHVLITADHGESFGEDGALGHDSRLTPEQIHVPLILVSPRVEPGARDDVVGTIDAYATILALAGLAPERGRSLTTPSDANAFAVGMRQFEPGGGTPRFYHANADTLVCGDGAALYTDDHEASALPPDARPEVRRAFDAFAAALAETVAAELDDDETRRTLEAMGYTGGE